MGTCIYESINNNQTETSEYEKESSFIFVIAVLFAVLWAVAGFTGVVAFACAFIAAVSAVAGGVMTYINRSRSSVVDI